VAEERIAQIRLDAATDRVEKLAHAEARRAGKQGSTNDVGSEAEQVGT
jgi:hypothetical protein